MRFDPAHFRHAVGGLAPRWPVELNRASPQVRGLAAAWPLFAGPGVGLVDLSSNGGGLVLGTGTETPAWKPNADFQSYGLDFDGGDEAHVAAGDVAALDITNDKITLTAWVFTDDLGDTNGNRIISKRTDAGGSDVYSLMRIVTGATNVLRFRLRIGGSSSNLDEAAGATGVWEHWVGTYDGVTMRLYRDGVQVASKAQTGNITASARAVYLGHREAEARYFDGAMADVRIYSRPLSAREVFALYDPQTRWDLYREFRVPRAWPAAGGGATTRTVIGSLQAAVRRQANVLASIDAALRAEAVLSALAGAALEGSVSGSASLDLAVQVLSVRLEMS